MGNNSSRSTQDGQLEAYPVGSEKEVEIAGTNYTVRVANNTTPTECNNADFSQTACGFVLEFVDIIETKQMNPSGTYNGKEYKYGWNVDGWPATAMRTYANGDFFNKLPSDLQNAIIETKVITGHGSEDTANFISTDKIYLLSGHEVYEDGTSNQISSYDTAWNNTRQLDYYKIKGVTTNEGAISSSYLGAIKQYNSSNSSWWLRAADSISYTNFLSVSSYGSWNHYTSADTTHGFAPAFRIG